MKRLCIGFVLCCTLTLMPTQQSHAFIWEIVRQAIIAAIKAADLAVQRLQNKTIWLQTVQKNLENILSKVKLDEITDWTKKHKEQYQQYFDELKQIKDAISTYKKVKEIIEKQKLLVDEYKVAFNRFKQDKHFTTGEITYMAQVYTGIMDQSVDNLDQLFLVIDAFNTEMTDGRRLEIISSVAKQVDDNLNDLRDFNRQCTLLSLQRSKDENELKTMRLYYGLPGN
ncbi:conjugal transfer protein TraI [Pinibacter aurantiacus]|uniref:Conjugal transfer protein TraI n=1 Tax=Pinibacter aurantiacus TaxID=2851599 RepID=A0A9E2W811_9BACT|nr:conjugal transfer protein TraI [Pinibacter aurantiacus]MBV4357317.1 conjugal transfer protein TraI [Pinibacter aurantiacus]